MREKLVTCAGCIKRMGNFDRKRTEWRREIDDFFFLMEPTNEKRVKLFLGATQEETTRKRNNFSVLRLHMRHENFTVPALTMCMTS